MLSFDDAGRGQAKAGLHDVVVVLLGALVASLMKKNTFTSFEWTHFIHQLLLHT